MLEFAVQNGPGRSSISERSRYCIDRTQRSLCAIGTLPGYIFFPSRLIHSYHALTTYLGNQSSAQRQRHLITQYGNQVDNSDDLRDSNQVNSSAENNGGLCNALSPLVSNWGSALGDIMLPARLLQRVDDGIMVPNLFWSCIHAHCDVMSAWMCRLRQPMSATVSDPVIEYHVSIMTRLQIV